MNNSELDKCVIVVLSIITIIWLTWFTYKLNTNADFKLYHRDTLIACPPNASEGRV